MNWQRFCEDVEVPVGLNLRETNLTNLTMLFPESGSMFKKQNPLFWFTIRLWFGLKYVHLLRKSMKKYEL